MSGDTFRRGLSNLLSLTTAQAAKSLIWTVSAVVIPRLLGVEQFGIYAAVLAMSGVLQVASSLGMKTVEVVFLPALWGQPERRGDAVALGTSILTFRLLLSLALGFVAFVWLARGSLGTGWSVGMLVGLSLFCALRGAGTALRDLLLPLGYPGRLAAIDAGEPLLRLLVVAGAFLAFGLAGVFRALVIMQLLLALVSAIILFRVFPYDLKLFRWSILRPYRSFALFSAVPVLGNMVQNQFAVLAMAAWANARQAALLAIAIPLYQLFWGVTVAANRSQIPVLSELEAAGRYPELKNRGSVLIRYGAAFSCVAFVGWIFLGEPIVLTVLGTDFSAVYEIEALFLGTAAFLSAAGTCNGLLLARKQPRWVTAEALFHTAIVLGGLTAALPGGEGSGAAMRFAVVCLAAAILRFGFAYLALGLRSGFWLPAGRVLLLLLPGLAAVPVLGWEMGFWTRLAALSVVVTAYGSFAVATGILSRRELRQLVRRLRAGGTSHAAA